MTISGRQVIRDGVLVRLVSWIMKLVSLLPQWFTKKLVSGNVFLCFLEGLLRTTGLCKLVSRFEKGLNLLLTGRFILKDP